MLFVYNIYKTRMKEPHFSSLCTVFLISSEKFPSFAAIC